MRNQSRYGCISLGALSINLAVNIGGCSHREPSGDPPTAEVESQLYTCSCYNKTDPRTGAVGRLFVDSSNEDFVLREDPATGDIYRWSGSGTTWQRIGGAARTYAAGSDGANHSVVYRLAGDGSVDMKGATVNDEFVAGGSWVRQRIAVARNLLVSAGAPYVFGPLHDHSAPNARIRDKTDQYILSTFNNPAIGSTVQIDVVNGAAEIAAAAYAEDSAGGALLYKKSSAATYVYNRATASWTQIGNTAVTAIFSAGGTVFARTPAGAIQKYLGTPLQWATTGGATNITKVTGNATAAYALAGTSVYQLSGTTWTVLPGISGAADIAAGPSHLYISKTNGNVIQVGGADISCSTAVSTTSCNGPAARACEPGPIPTGVAPAFTDAAKATQDNPVNARYDVLTQHNDNARTGAATSEDVLTPSSLVTGQFGYLRSVALPGKTYGQPLYLEKAAVRCGKPAGAVQNVNIAFVTTLDNIVVAVNLDDSSTDVGYGPGICWATPALACPQPVWVCDGLDGACNQNFDMSNGDHREGGVTVGIVSTPVIDRARDVLYVMARTRDGNDALGRYFLYVLNTRTGELVAKVEAIADTLGGRSDCMEPNGSVFGHAFHPSLNTNRVGLLLSSNIVYAAFSSNGGENSNIDYHGHVLGFDVTNPANPVNLTSSFCATPSSAGGGIWMAGGGMASDGSNAYFTTGNGAYSPGDPCGQPQKISEIKDFPFFGDYSDSFVKLSSNMSATGYTDTRYASELTGFQLEHCPMGCQGCDSNHKCSVDTNVFCTQRTMFWARERSDADFGSGGVLVIGNRLVGGGKDGRLYVIDRASMSLQQDFQAFLNTYEPSSTFLYDRPWYYGPHLHGGPVALDTGPATTYVYAWSEKDHLKRFVYDKSSNLFVLPDPQNPKSLDATAGNPFPTAHSDIASSAAPSFQGGVITPGAMPGGMLSVSSNGTAANSAIVWATTQEPYKFCTKVDNGSGVWKVQIDQPPTPLEDIPGCDVVGGYVPGRLYAFATEPDSYGRLKLLWGDTAAGSPNNLIPSYAKHAPPTIAHGKVLVATANNELRIYGLGSAQQGQPPTGSLTYDNIAVVPPPGATPATAPPGLSTWLTHQPLAAAPSSDGSFNVTLDPQSAFLGFAATCSQRWDGVWTHAEALTGDFNGDGRTDIALTGAASFTSVKVLLSNGNGSFTLEQWTPDDPSFNGWATSQTATRLAGNFGNAAGGTDNFTDIALVGDTGFCTIPMAFADPANHRFVVKNINAGSFTGACTPSINGGWAASAPTRLVGDFSGSGRAEIALAGVAVWWTIPIARWLGNNQFSVTNRVVGGQDLTDPAKRAPLWPNSTDVAPYSQFAAWAAAKDANNVDVARLAGDINGDGRTDIVLLGGSGWWTVPVAFGSGNGTFRIANRCAAPSCSPLDVPFDFATLAALAAPKRRLIGDFNGDGRADLAVIDPSNSAASIAVAFSNGDGSFRLTRGATHPDFALWASTEAIPVVGDFNHDGSADIALVGTRGWVTIPVALSRGDGSFDVKNVPGAANMGTFQSSAASTAVCNGVTYPATILPGNYR